MNISIDTVSNGFILKITKDVDINALAAASTITRIGEERCVYASADCLLARIREELIDEGLMDKK